LFLGGFGAWTWGVHVWAMHYHHHGLVSGDRPAYLAIAAITYWPVAVGIWLLLFPGDKSALPWAGRI
jgi:hypothetical protein